MGSTEATDTRGDLGYSRNSEAQIARRVSTRAHRPRNSALPSHREAPSALSEAVDGIWLDDGLHGDRSVIVWISEGLRRHSRAGPKRIGGGHP